MVEAQDPKGEGPSGDPKLSAPAVTRSDKPNLSQGEEPKRFKLKLSLPGQNIGGEWLCRATGQAQISQYYCDTQGTPREFTWYTHSDNKTYLKDQEGYWLTHGMGRLLKMSDWTCAVAWAIDGNRLIREGGYVLTWRPNQHYPSDTGKYYLSADPKSEYALTVAWVYV